MSAPIAPPSSIAPRSIFSPRSRQLVPASADASAHDDQGLDPLSTRSRTAGGDQGPGRLCKRRSDQAASSIRRAPSNACWPRSRITGARRATSRSWRTKSAPTDDAGPPPPMSSAGSPASRTPVGGPKSLPSAPAEGKSGHGEAARPCYGLWPLPSESPDPSAGLPPGSAIPPPDLDAQLHVRVVPPAWQAAGSMPRLTRGLQPRSRRSVRRGPRAETFGRALGPQPRPRGAAMPTGIRPSGRSSPPKGRPLRHRAVGRSDSPSISALAASPPRRPAPPGPISAIFSSIARSLGSRSTVPASRPVRPCSTSCRPGGSVERDRSCAARTSFALVATYAGHPRR